MSAYTINQLRANAPAEFRNLDDEDLVREYARVKQIPFEQAADYYGVKPRGTLGEIGRQMAGGAVVDLPRMVGQSLKATGLAPEFGEELVQGAEERAYRFDPDQRAERGLVGQALTLGARGLAPMAPALAAAFVPGGQVVAPTVAAGLFGTSAYQDTYEKVLEQTGNEEAARAAALRAGALQGPAEGVATAVGLRAIRPIAAAVRGTPTTGRVAQAMTDTGVLRPVARGMAINLAVQPTTEVVQDVGTELIERAYGAAPEDIGEIATQSALGGAGLTFFLGPLAVGGAMQRSRNAQRLKEALDPEADVDPAFRAQALDVVMAEARRQNVAEQDIDQWFERQLLAEDMRTELLRMQEEKRQTLNRESDLLQRAGLEGITTEPDPLQQRIDESLGIVRPEGEDGYADAFTQAYNEPSGLFIRGEPGQPPIELTNGQLIEMRATGQDMEILTPDQVGRPITGELTPLQRLALQGPTAPRPVTGGLTELQRLSAIGPIGEGMTPMQQAAVAGPREVPTPVTGGARALTPGQRTALIGPTIGQPSRIDQALQGVDLNLPSDQVSMPGVSEPAGTSPAAPAAAGAFSQPQGRTRGTQAPQAQQTETQGQAAPAAEPVLNAQDNQALLDLIEESNRDASTGRALPAEVRADQRIAAPGRVSFSNTALGRIRDGLIKGKEGLNQREQAVIDSLNALSAAYKKYLDVGGEVRRGAGSTAIGERTRAKGAAEASARLRAASASVRSALVAVGNAVGGNAKDVEAVVRLVKNMAQGKLTVPGRTRSEVVRAMQKLDVNLSAAWNAAKREVFRGETADRADVRGQVIRPATERAGEKSPIEAAVTDGYLSLGDQRIIDGEVNRLRKRLEDEGASKAEIKRQTDALRASRSDELRSQRTGITAALQYIIDSGTPFERTLGTALRDTLDNQMNDATVEFIDSGDPRFDPATNTIFLRRAESPEVILHETLHAALQSYVYNNPNDPAIAGLKKSLKQVIDYKGTLGAEAKKIQTLLSNLVKEGNELDAVLELVSYGNTFNEFRRAMQAMPAKGTPKSFFDSVSQLWNYIRDALSDMLGVNKTVANNVLDSSVALLSRAGKQTPVRGKGRVLTASVRSDAQTTATDPATTPVSTVVQDLQTQTNAQVAAQANYPSFKAYSDTPPASYNLTRKFFERVGISKEGAGTQKIRGGLTKVAQAIRENFPALEGVILNINSRFSLPPGFDTIIEYFKTHQNTGILEMEKMTEAMQQDPALAAPILDYLDGNRNAFDGRKDKATLTAIGDNVRYHLQTYINSLPANSRERALFSNLKFTDYLLHPESFSQLANKSFGVKKLSTLLGMKDRREESIDTFSAFLPMKNGVVDSDAPLYQLTQVIQDNDGNNVTVPWGFISKEMADKNPPAGLDIDKSRIWKFDGMAGKQFKFISRARTGADIRTMAQEGKVDELSATLLNTMAALSHNYASRNYFRGLTSFGLDADGNRTARSVVFDNVDQINEVFKGRALTDDKVFEANQDEAKSLAISGKARLSGMWVRLPAGDAYGELAGKIIPGPVWGSMIDMHDRSPLFNSEAFNGTMRWFKKAKTVYTPATHANNILTNYSLMLLHGISHRNLRDAAVMFAKFERSPDKMSPQQRDMMQAFYRSGAVLGQYTQTEAKQVIADALIASISPSPSGSMLKRMTELAKFEKTFAENLERLSRKASNFDSNMVNLYAAGDNIFRLAAFMNTAGNIQTRDGTAQINEAQLAEAGIAARKMFLDYDIDSRWVRAARQSFFPFVSWSYAIMPVLGRLAIEKPWTMVNMMAAIGLMSAVFDGDDEEEWRLTGPDQVREKALWGLGPHMFMRVPFMGDDENPVYWNIGKSIPMMTLFNPPPGESKLFGQSWIPGFITPGGPYANIIAAGLFGVDPFTGKKLSDETSDNFDRFASAAKTIYNTMTPSFAQTRFFENIDALAQGKVGPTGVEPDALFLARLGGLTLYEFNRQETDFYNDKEIQRIKRDFSMAMSKAKRDEYNKGYPDYEALDAELAGLRERLEKRIAEVRGEK